MTQLLHVVTIQFFAITINYCDQAVAKSTFME